MGNNEYLVFIINILIQSSLPSDHNLKDSMLKGQQHLLVLEYYYEVQPYLSRSFSTMSNMPLSWQNRSTRCWFTTGTSVPSTPMPQSFKSCLKKKSHRYEFIWRLHRPPRETYKTFKNLYFRKIKNPSKKKCYLG